MLRGDPLKPINGLDEHWKVKEGVCWEGLNAGQGKLETLMLWLPLEGGSCGGAGHHR